MSWNGVRVVAVMTAVCAAAAAVAQVPFYTSLFRRGVASYEKGDYTKAVSELRLAAFGLLNNVPQYELAQVYLVLAHDKLQHKSDATQAAQKLANAERAEPSYGALTLDAGLRRDFEQLLPSLLPADELASSPALGAIAMRGTKSWTDVINLYSTIRTRRRLTNDELATLFNALVQAGRIADAAGLRPLLPQAVLGSPALAAALGRLPATPPSSAGGSSMTLSVNGDVAGQLREAESDVTQARFAAARQIYMRLALQPGLRREWSLEIARGLHRVSALRDSSALYQKLYPLRAGEEQHMVAEAVNRFELGDLATARLLIGRAEAAVKPTPEFVLYRPRIESGR
jgi:hypothetical protein